MTTTQTISRERLEEIIGVINAGAYGYSISAEEIGSMARMLLAAMDSEPVGWIYEDELPENYPYDAMFPYSKVDIVRIFPVFAPPAPAMPAELHSDTQKLVAEFCTALAEKLYKAQLKYGYSANWKYDNWQADCLAHFHQHIDKGDPRDVAAYCAFMWYHGWKTEPEPVAVQIPPKKPHTDGLLADGWIACRAAMLNTGPVTGWIKCSERMPEDIPGSVEYVVYETLNNRVQHDYWNASGEDDEFSPFWNKYGNYVTHWMPLPAAPEQEV